MQIHGHADGDREGCELRRGQLERADHPAEGAHDDALLEETDEHNEGGAARPEHEIRHGDIRREDLGGDR